MQGVLFIIKTNNENFINHKIIPSKEIIFLVICKKKTKKIFDIIIKGIPCINFTSHMFHNSDEKIHYLKNK